jgi:hypothetical protein
MGVSNGVVFGHVNAHAPASIGDSALPGHSYSLGRFARAKTALYGVKLPIGTNYNVESRQHRILLYRYYDSKRVG